jgi:hypothetical protein
MKKAIFAGILIFNSYLAQCHTPAKDVAVTFGSDILLSVNSMGLSPEMSITALFLNTAASIQYRNTAEPVYSLYLGIGLFNILELQYGYSGYNKIRFRTELPMLSSFPLWKNEPETWQDRINLKLQYEINLDNPPLNTFGFGVSYLVN